MEYRFTHSVSAVREAARHQGMGILCGGRDDMVSAMGEAVSSGKGGLSYKGFGRWKSDTAVPTGIGVCSELTRSRKHSFKYGQQVGELQSAAQRFIAVEMLRAGDGECLKTCAS